MDVRRATYVLAALLGLSLAYDVARIPIQVADGVDEIVDARKFTSVAEAFVSGLGQRVYMRPFRIAQSKMLYDISGGHYTVAFRGFHALLVVLTLLMFVRVLRVRTLTDVAAAMFALTVLVGLHTFSGLLREAYPVQHFLEVVLFGLIALDLAQSRPGWIVDVAAALTFAAAAFTLESGVLIAVIIGAAWLTGLRGVSWRGMAAIAVLIVAYAYVRFIGFPTGFFPIDERPAGLFLDVLDSAELKARFSQNPLPFYVYNVGASAVSVLTAEPRHGVWVIVREYLHGEVAPWMLVAIISSCLTTMGIAVAAFVSWHDRDHRDDADRLFVIFAIVLVLNAVLSYAYTKDEVMSLSGAFYALAAYAAVRRLIHACAGGVRPWRASVLVAAMLVASAGWAIRTEGLHYSLRYMAFKTRNEWPALPARLARNAEARPLIERLRSDALDARVVAPRFVPAWEARWFEED